MTKKIIQDISYAIIGSAIEVHKELGPGLLESIYKKCLKHELLVRGLQVRNQVSVPIIYKGKEIACDLKLDLIVNELIIVEIKSVESMIPVFKAQLMTYLKLLDKPKGLLINFNTVNIKDTVISMVTEKFSKLQD